MEIIQVQAGLGTEMNKTETTTEDRCVRGRGRWAGGGLKQLT